MFVSPVSVEINFKKRNNVQENGAIHHFLMVRYPLEEETMQFGKKSRHFLIGKFGQHQRYLTACYLALMYNTPGERIDTTLTSIRSST